MSIYIKDMEMPKDCWHCPMINSSDECCLLTEEQHDMYEEVMDQVRAAFCPLIEIPPHGRLIDADAFERKVMFGDEEDLQDVIYSLRDFPTIIQTDKED